MLIGIILTILILGIFVFVITKSVIKTSALENTVVENYKDEVAASGDSDNNGSQETVSEFYCFVDTKEEAEKIAQAYGIELVKFEVGIASFRANEDSAKVMERGKREGLPKLSINTKTYLD